jgi:hypothetical protein
LGGYNVKGKIEIMSGNYYVKNAELWFSIGQIFEFFVQLQKCYNELKGCATFSEAENILKVELIFNRIGKVNIQGYFQELTHQENILHFEIESNQSYMASTLSQLKNIVDHYGDMKGKK